MTDYTKIVVVPRTPTVILSGEFGLKIANFNVGIQHRIGPDGTKIESVFGSQLSALIGGSAPTADPSDVGYVISSPTGPFGGPYIGLDKGRGLVVGLRAGNDALGTYVDTGIAVQGFTRSFVDSDVYGITAGGVSELVHQVRGVPGGGINAFYRDASGQMQLDTPKNLALLTRP